MKIVKVGLYILKYMYIVYKCLIYKQNMAVFVLQGHIINKHVYFRSINGLKALVYDIVLFKL